MRKPRIHNFDEKAQEAAYLKIESRLSQQAIADILGVGQSAVWRLLNRARELGCLREVAQFVRTSDIDDERMRYFESRLEHADLAERLAGLPARNGLRLKSVRIVDSGSTDTSPASIERRQRKFGEGAAPRIAERLSTASLVGITWGSTVSRVLDGLSRLGYPWPKNPARRVVPVSAEPMRFAHNEYTSSTLARRLFEIMGSTNESDRLLALTGVPAFIPSDVSRVIPETRQLPKKVRDQLPRIFRRFFEENSTAFKHLFVGDRALIDEMDILITSVGAADKPMGFCNDDLLKFSNLRSDAVKRLIVGDLGGVLLPKPGLGSHDVAKVEALNAMWTGIQRRHLETIARRAQERGTPGVVLVTLGASRSEIVLEAIAQGLCSELIIDGDLATALTDKLDAMSGEPRRRRKG